MALKCLHGLSTSSTRKLTLTDRPSLVEAWEDKTMKAYRRWMVAGLALATVVTVPAFGQSRDSDDRRDGWYQDRDHDRDDHDRDDQDRDRGRWRNSRAYRRGYDDAMHDRDRNRGYRANPWRLGNDEDRRAYQQGYYDGYNRGRNNRSWGYNNGGWRGNPGWGRGSGGYQAGYQNGLSYGQHDRSVGKPFRPTDSGVYRDGDRGYNSGYGDKGLYKSQFRQGYEQGYQRGYYGR